MEDAHSVTVEGRVGESDAYSLDTGTDIFSLLSFVDFPSKFGNVSVFIIFKTAESNFSRI